VQTVCCGRPAATGERKAMTGEANGDRRAALQELLIEMRQVALARMMSCGSVEPGHLPLIPGINAALDVLDMIPIEGIPARGREIRLTLYSEAAAAAAVELDAVRAVALASS